MKGEMKKLGILMLVVIGLILLQACEKDNNNGSDLPEEILLLNNWIWEGMNEVYLWETYIPNLDPDVEPDPEAFFYKLLYEEDHNSWIVDDYEELVAMFDGVELSTGMSVDPQKYTETQVVYFVEFVSENSPAADSGITRGDIIYTIDGNLITTSNYRELYYQTTATFGFADWNGDRLIPNDRSITLEAIVLNQNPVNYDEVIDYQGQKIGYFVYTQFTTGQSGEWLDELNRVFGDFKSEGVSDVVVDLRYNPGGSLDLSAYMASTLGPEAVMQENEVFVNLVWNNLYNNYWAGADLDQDGQPDGEDSEQLRIFMPDSDLNLDLSTVYFLTTGGTASACESLMTGLYPYMNVVQIGETTYGKCYASITVDDWEEPKRHNWAMQPIVIKYSNAEGFTDFVNGITPDYDVDDNLLYALPFGSLEDPLLAKALELITGVSPLVKKSVGPESHFPSLPLPRKPVEEWRVELPERH
ncbi:MAG: S41 family peptidase [Bacteroidota bacterium]|nr:S41 family peptidase [Bacteroidota bacterium]